MTRFPLLLLVLAALLTAGCGDGEESTGAGGGETAARTEAGTSTAATASGCRRAEEPEAKTVKDRKRPSFRVRKGAEYVAVMKTSCGTIEIELAAARAPKTVSSFIALAREDFYDGLGFHRIVPGFVVQGGDPAGTGEGGPGYEVVETPPSDLKYEKGVVAMAKTELDDPGTSGSQFFIVTADDAGLPADYALLGRVRGGDEVLEKLSNAPNEPADNRPTEPVVIDDVTIRQS